MFLGYVKGFTGIWVSKRAWVLNWYLDIECASRAGFFIVPRTFSPDFTAMCCNNAAGNWQTQAGPAAFEFGLAGGVQRHLPRLVEFFEDNFDLVWIDTNTRVGNGELDKFRRMINMVGDLDLAAVWRVFDGVHHQLQEYFLK